MKAVLVAGGTGGHLFPALALAEHLQGQGPCLILSTARPVDRQIASGSMEKRRVNGGIVWRTVDLKRFTPLWRWLFPRYTFRQIKAIQEIWAILRSDRPDVVVGFGGYVSAIGAAASRLLGLPTVLHEQNLIPGKANRLLSRWCACVAVSFPETKGYLPKKALVEVTGNPLRRRPEGIDLEKARADFGFDRERPVLLIMGGSQGSQVINSVCIQMWRELPSHERDSLQVIHLTGSSQVSEAKQFYRQLGMTAQVFAFLYEISRAYSLACLTIARAGATTIAELLEYQLPAILIPYPHAGGHQRANAWWLESAGGAKVLEQERLTPRSLWQEVSKLLKSPQLLSQMRASLAFKRNGSAVDRLESLVFRLAKRQAQPP